MNVDEFKVSDCCELYWMKFARLIRVEPRQKHLHEDVNLAWLRRNVIADVDLRAPESTTLNGINMAKHPLVDL